MKIGYTRDFDNPNSEEKKDPNAGVVARFFESYKPVHDIMGEPVLGEDGIQKMSGPILMIEFVTAADPKSVFVTKANDSHKREWAQAYDAFKKGTDFTKASGTPLTQMPGLDIMQQMWLHGKNIYSIEQLSTLSENIVLGSPGIRLWVNKAREYLLQNKPKPNQELLDKMAAMEAELAALKAAPKAPKSKPQEGIAA